MLCDIRRIAPQEGEAFFVDTNVWYWMTYVAAKDFFPKGPKGPKDYQISEYPEFVEKAIENKASLYYSPLALVELAGLIERAEFEIFKLYENDPSFQFKRFRRDENQRKAVIREIQVAWGQVKQMASELPVQLGDGLDAEILDYLKSFNIDGYDGIYYFFMKKNNIYKIITDDKDFRGVEGVEVYACYAD